MSESQNTEHVPPSVKSAPPSIECVPPSIECVRNGPLRVKGRPKLRNSKGQELPMQETTALCSCGGSAKKPYCDGTHRSNGFSSEKSAERADADAVEKTIAIIEQCPILAGARSWKTHQ